MQLLLLLVHALLDIDALRILIRWTLQREFCDPVRQPDPQVRPAGQTRRPVPASPTRRTDLLDNQRGPERAEARHREHVTWHTDY